MAKKVAKPKPKKPGTTKPIIPPIPTGGFCKPGKPIPTGCKPGKPIPTGCKPKGSTKR